MAERTFDQLFGNPGGSPNWLRIQECLAILASGQNPDGTAHTLATSATIATPGPLDGNAPGTATVTTSSGSAVAANANRKGLVLVNVGAVRCSLGFGQTAVLDRGITLYPSGGAFSMDAYSFTLEVINAIAAAGGTTLAVQELV